MAGESSVFISYTNGTKPRAQELTRALESEGIESWVDFKDLRPGQRWKEELDRAIMAARFVVILVGADNRATAWQEAEWSTALARSWEDSDKRLLPVVFGETETPPFLRNWVPLRVASDQDPATWTHRVLDALQEGRGEVAKEVAGQNRRERQNRLDEIGRAARELRHDAPDELPIEPKARPQ